MHDDVRCQLEAGHYAAHRWSAPWPEFAQTIEWPSGSRAPRQPAIRQPAPQLDGQLQFEVDT